MGYTWSAGADAVRQHTAVDWDGVWSLLYAAGKAAFRLSLQLPIGIGAELAYAGMDICEARDEIGWAHPEVTATAIAVDLGPSARPSTCRPRAVCSSGCWTPPSTG